MSRVSKNPIPVPSNVEVLISPSEISVKGPLGNLKQRISSDVSLEMDNSFINVKTLNDSKHANAMSGTIRALVANLVKGVSEGFEKKLLLVGVGYRAQANATNINLMLGFSHTIDHAIPPGISIETPIQTEIIIKGIDKQQVGQVAAEIRSYRRPEPYKGKGVRYSDEIIVLKEAKKK